MSVEQLWDSMTDEEKWETHRKRAVDRMSNVNIAVGAIGVAPVVY